MRKMNLKWTIAIVLIFVLAIGVITALVKIDRSETTKTIGSSVLTYNIGTNKARLQFI